MRTQPYGLMTCSRPSLLTTLKRLPLRLVDNTSLRPMHAV